MTPSQCRDAGHIIPFLVLFDNCREFPFHSSVGGFEFLILSVVTSEDSPQWTDPHPSPANGGRTAKVPCGLTALSSRRPDADSPPPESEALRRFPA
jgi:hypothetical protein